MGKNESIAMGVIGAGRIGRLHAENLALRVPGARLAAVADIDLEAASEVGARFGIPLVSGDYRAMLEDPGVEAVAICSSTDTHSQIITEAAQAGKHIFCEKPIDFDLGRIDRALQAVEQAGVTLMVGFNRRFDPNFSKVREMVAEGRIGQPHILRITSRDPEPPPIEYVRVSGGIFLDMTIHDFDMARFLMGSEVTEIYVAGAVLVDPRIGEEGDIDTAVITLRFENGAIGTIDNSRRAVYGYDQRVEVFGSEGMVRVGNNTPDRHEYSNTQGVHSSLPLYFFLERYTESYAVELRQFIESLVEGRPPPVGGMDGRIPVVMGLAAQRSYQEGRPVRLAEVAS